MYRQNRICVIVPAFNEVDQIGRVIESMPDFVDHILIVDDCSTDGTVDVVKKYQDALVRISLIVHERNKGVGAAIATGCKWALQQDFDIVVRMDGDGQMDPKDLPTLLDPVVEDRADYAKGNRFFSGQAFRRMPKKRYFGNAFLSLLTKIASGYWHIADFQSGYTAINRIALETIDWDAMYTQYGQPNDLIVRLNVNNFRIIDVPVDPLYNIGEKSGIKIFKVIFTISWLLIKLFFWRMKEKYVIRDFHPLIFFYALGLFFGITSSVLFIRVFYYWFTTDNIPSINALAAFFSFNSAVLFTLFAMWFDMEANKDLKGWVRRKP